MGSLWKPHQQDPPETGEMPGSDFGVWLHEGVVLIGLTALGISAGKGSPVVQTSPFPPPLLFPQDVGMNWGEERGQLCSMCVYTGIMDLWGQGTDPQKCSLNL